MALTDNLVSYWKLDEASGTRADSQSTNDLTERTGSSVGSTTGKINSAGVFVRSEADGLEHADNAELSVGDIDFTVAIWIKPGNILNRQNIWAKADGSSGGYFLLYDETASRFKFQVFSASGFGGTSTTVTANNLGAPSSGTWYYLIAWHDSVNNQIGIAGNAGTADTAAHSAGVYDGAEGIQIGWDSFANYLEGDLDEAGFWKRVLTSGERTQLYNGGNGLAYPFTTSTNVARLVGGNLTDSILLNGALVA